MADFKPKGFFQDDFDQVEFEADGKPGLAELSEHFHGGAYIHWHSMGVHINNLSDDSEVKAAALDAIAKAGYRKCVGADHFVDKTDIIGDGADMCRVCYREAELKYRVEHRDTPESAWKTIATFEGSSARDLADNYVSMNARDPKNPRLDYRITPTRESK